MATDRDEFFADTGDFQEIVVQVNRSAKVVKGGRRFSFSALVVVGDRRGRVGVGYGKANEVPPAVDKGIAEAKKNLRRINLTGDTIPHQVVGRFGSARVFMRPAMAGTGCIAGGGVRAVCQMVGIRNILTKSMGSTNPVNLVKAAMDGLVRLKDVREVARLRGVPVEELIPAAAAKEQAREAPPAAPSMPKPKTAPAQAAPADVPAGAGTPDAPAPDQPPPVAEEGTTP